ncbi:hypothetical protein SAMN06265375_103410 [Muriicola jejuensis]|uniref:DUF1853 family protein n=1 Tax=Muriicola jejuensis TaxID=504488 RepID=A0A6P0UHD8_9FLAO|nr:DUF1853 family protein [Muriicola jejuensis]NER11239.1 DUF1853 family protein [Muriicola jejuensis]SMP21851.1 hypothetical protein SAMN06265375_103410 [Muriicola jejuensis]
MLIFASMEGLFTQMARAFISTPPLWTRSQFGLQQFPFPEIDLARVKPVTFGSSMRLGHKMERIFTALLEGQDTYELIMENVVIKKDKKTLGEIDFLLKDLRNDRQLHLELTYKFYLADTDISEPIFRLVGPNRRDMFYTKLEKLRESQLTLPHTIEGTKTLRAMEMEPEFLEQQVCFKAQLFRPYRSARLGIRPLNKSCIAGTWMRFQDFESAGFKTHQYYFPSKDEWVISPYNTADWISHFNALIELNIRMIKKSSTLVWMRKKEGSLEKFFVVWW